MHTDRQYNVSKHNDINDKLYNQYVGVLLLVNNTDKSVDDYHDCFNISIVL